MSDYVLDYVWAFALALIITFALTPLVKRFAVAVGAIDKPDATIWLCTWYSYSCARWHLG